jgi:hypothetical protein
MMKMRLLLVGFAVLGLVGYRLVGDGTQAQVAQSPAKPSTQSARRNPEEAKTPAWIVYSLIDDPTKVVVL